MFPPAYRIRFVNGVVMTPCENEFQSYERRFLAKTADRSESVDGTNHPEPPRQIVSLPQLVPLTIASNSA